jgi:starch synthase
MRILIASPEAVPYVKTGGLADVAGTLCKEFRKMREDAYSILPLYKKIKDNHAHLEDNGLIIKVPVGDRVIEGRIFSDRISTYFIACDEFFDRAELYGTPEGDYGDNASRFVFFSRGVLEACRVLNFRPDIIHCNDWQTGLIPLYLRTIYKDEPFFKKTATLLTIHNLGYQGLFPPSEMASTNLGRELYTPEGMEFYGKVNFLKAGIISADLLTTVSSTYAREILNPDSGFGLDGVLKNRENDLYGIVNGIDSEEWDPSRDKFLPATYHHHDLSGKAACKRELISTLFRTSERRHDEAAPVIGMVTRMSEQKGLDILIRVLPELLSFRMKLVILGKGDERFQRSLQEISGKYREMVSITIGFDETLAHRIYAGSDFFLMPSKYEPCGLGQLISLRYGSIPVARRTGGFVDTVRDFDPLTSTGTGFLFSDYTPSAMLDALKRAFCVYTDSGKMQKMIRDGMKMDFSWKRSAVKYIELYTTALMKKRA